MEKIWNGEFLWWNKWDFAGDMPFGGAGELCGQWDFSKKAVSRAVGVDCSSVEMSESYDSHDLGEGTTFYAMHFIEPLFI